MNETIVKGLKGCLIAVAVAILVGTAYFAGYVGGSRSAATPVASQTESQEGQTIPTAAAASTCTPVTQVVTATPDPTQPESTEPGSVFPTPPSQPEISIDLYWEVWDLVERDFYGNLPSDEERLYGAIRGSLQTLDDDHTAFTERDIAEINRSDMGGSFEGIGAVVQMNERDQIEIVRPMEGQPAEDAGLRPGDLVLAVDGQSTDNMGLYEAIALIRGPRGSTVTLTILRPGESDAYDVEIVRARIPLPTVESEILEGNIAYLRLYEFNSQATDLLQDAIEDLLDQQPVGLVLDLRNNPGGFLSQAVSVADEFLPAGVVLIERGQDLERTFDSSKAGSAEEIPLVVLINGGSASASEIVAGAIQDRERGMLIGETSFGKGSVQQPHTLSDGSELRITIARWFTPNDRAIHGNGLEPDIPVPFTEEDLDNDLDPQLDRAVEYLITGE